MGPIRLNLVDDQGAVDTLVVADTLVLSPSAPELTLWSNVACSQSLTTSPLMAGAQGLDVYAQASATGAYQIAASAARIVGNQVTLAPDTEQFDAGGSDAGTMGTGNDETPGLQPLAALILCRRRNSA